MLELELNQVNAERYKIVKNYWLKYQITIEKCSCCKNVTRKKMKQEKK